MSLHDLDINFVDGYAQYTSKGVLNPENLIIHGISDPRSPTPFDANVVLDLFHEYGVSSHFVIDRAGTIFQLILIDKIAWHAGLSEYNGNNGLNDNSIGIELIGDKRTPYENAQYNSLALLAGNLCVEKGISLSNVKGHQMVSDSDVRRDPKWDPGRYFDWIRFGYDLTSYVRYLKNEQE